MPHPYFQTNTSPDVFTAQMRYLRDAAYRTISLGEAVAALKQGKLDKRAVVLTFDDGYLDFYSAALPVLLQCGFTATVFIVSSYADSLASLRNDLYMQWPQLREIVSQGIEVGSHTASHLPLQALRGEEIECELRESTTTIEQHIGRAVRSFSFPFAFPEHDRTFIRFMREKLAELGYAQAVSTVIGRARKWSDPFRLPRIPINSHDDQKLFAAKLEGGYDWMHAAQSAHKRFHPAKRWSTVLREQSDQV